MNIKIIVTTVIVFLVGSFFVPGDPLSSLVFGIESAFLCCVSLLILARRKFVKSSSNSMHTLVCILVCIISVLSVYWFNSGGYKYFYPSSSDTSQFSYASSSGFIRFSNLWGRYSFNKNIFCSIFSVDNPVEIKYSSATNNWKLTFSDSNSVEFNILRNETVWIDKKHRITFLGEVLSKEDMLFLSNLSHDKELKISSPDELLTTFYKLKAEQTASVNPP